MPASADNTRERGYERRQESRLTKLLGDDPAIRYYPPRGDLHFDILTRLGRAARFETIESETKDLGNARVPVATPPALYRRGVFRFRSIEDARPTIRLIRE